MKILRTKNSEAKTDGLTSALGARGSLIPADNADVSSSLKKQLCKQNRQERKLSLSSA